MVTLDTRLAALSSPDLLAALERTAAQGREVTADLIALLAECDARQLYATEGYPSLFEFCVARLRLSEAQAYHRIQAARAARRFPLVLERLREGRVSLTAVALLREHLTEANHREVLDWAEGRRKREVESFVRQLDPQPDAPPSLRRLAPPPAPVPAPLALAADRATRVRAVVDNASSRDEATALAELLATPAVSPQVPLASAAPVVARAAIGAARAARAEIRPTAPARYSLHVTISEETADKLRRAQALLGHALPSADPALVLDRALTLLLAQLERRKAGASRKPGRSADGGACRKKVKTAGRPAAPATSTVSVTSTALPPPTTASTPPVADTGVGHARETSNCMPTVNGASRSPHPPHGATGRARRSRYIPAAVRRAVWDRDGGCCAYVSSSGTRCTATTALEFHHRIPFAEGGASTVENVSLACTRHNAVEAVRWFNFDRTEFGVGESGDLMAGRDAGPTTCLDT